MRAIQKPLMDVKSVIELCANNLRDKDLAARLRSSAVYIEAYENLYESKGSIQELYSFPENVNVPTVSIDEMKKLYTNTFARKNGPTRGIYDAIKLLAPGDICPLCNQRTVSTLDHHLSKSQHPLFAVTPINLVPACKDCNTDTSARRPTTSAEQTLHPYFDSVDEYIWLSAMVEESDPPVVVFYADPPDVWGDVKKAMVVSHFDTFGLGKLYTTHAAVELGNIFGDIEVVDKVGGTTAVHDELMARAIRRRRIMKNTWQAAMLEALGNSKWFCDGGYKKITNNHEKH